jgi:dihydropteroate synthase
MRWRFRGYDRDLGAMADALVMGVVNITPDSFSEGGRHLGAERAIAHALALVDQRADVLDVGGESTRPGAAPVDAATEMARVVPVVRAVAPRIGIPVSVDTHKAVVAQAALEAGARVVNDVSALGDPDMAEVVRRAGAGLVLMHMRGTPATMQSGDLSSNDIVRDVCEALAERLQFAVGAGIDRDAIVLDPGIGFGKTQAQNLALLRGLDRLRALGRPVLVGVSRKSLIGHLTGRPVEARLAGSLGGALGALHLGARIVRVHDVAETRDALRVMLAVLGGEDRDGEPHA